MSIKYYFKEQDHLWDRLCKASQKQYNYTSSVHPADRLQSIVFNNGGKTLYCNSQIVALEFETEEDLLLFILKL